MVSVLIVEDEPFIRQSAEWMLEDNGHSILSAGDLGEALVHLTGPGPIDALFVDMRLSVLPLGGYDVANQAVVLRPGLRVLYTSGTPLNPEMAARFVPGGAFIQKPYSAEQLSASMERLLA